MAINDISLTAGMRSNLVALQSTVSLLNRTQGRLSSGKKVNSALDDPLSYFTAQTLNSRASDLAGYKNGMSEAVQTINAANNGITALGSLIEQAKALAASAKASPLGGGATSLYTFTLSNVNNGDQVKIGNTTFTAVDSAHATQINSSYAVTLTSVAMGSEIAINGQTYVASTGNGAAGGKQYFNASGNDAADAAALKARMDIVADPTITSGVNSNVITVQQVTPGTPAGSWVVAGPGGYAATATQAPDWTTLSATQFRIGTTTDLTAGYLAAKATGAGNADLFTVAALGSGGQFTVALGGGTQPHLNDATRTGIVSGSSTVAVTASSDQRKSYADQFVSLMAQFDGVAKDSGYKGVNFLDSGVLALDFGNSHTLNMTGFDASSATLVGTAVADAGTNHWASDTNINDAVTGLTNATATLKTQSSGLSSNLSIINVRQDWTTSMVNTLTQGADNLTLADMNEEGANMLMLQTRQSLGTTALSLSSQAAQSVLRLFQ